MHRLTRICVIVLLLLSAGCDDPKPAGSSRPRVLIISIDGLRPDMLLRSDAPNLRQLMRNGAYTMWARTTEISITLPSHTSMLTGVTPERHDIWWNADPPKEKERPPAVPTIFELAKQRGYTTGMATGKSKFDALVGIRHPGQPHPVDFAAIPHVPITNNAEVAANAARIISQDHPEVMFVHLPDVDARGHGNGWGSDPQRKAVETADQAVGTVLQALRREGLLDSTTIIVSADHGGSGTTHGAEDYRSRHIPWIISGPNTRRNLDLTTNRELMINTEDTFATACYILGIPLDEDLDGKPITQAFVETKPKELVVSR